MRPEKSSRLVSWIGVALLVSPLAAGCSQSGSGAPIPGTGGAANGGNAGSGGSGSGGSAAGGTTSAGGSVSSGGAAATGGAAGAKTGGATGGTTGTGTASTGGAKASGGVTSDGGANAGGATAVGGATGNGGATGKGGTGTGTAATGGAAGGGTSAPATGGTAGSGGCPELPAAPVAASDIIQFNDNGGWCWYQDERAVVDTKGGKLVIGSVASGGSRNGNIEAVIYDLATKKASAPAKLGNLSIDDHNAPAFVVRPDGKYVAVYSTHRLDCYTRWSIYSGSSWGAEQKFDWAKLGCPWAGASTNMITYSNPWYIGTSILTGVRSVDTSPSFLTSTDDGASWSYYGRLTSTKQTGYVAGYYKYWGNNTDRIDFVGTEAHPRDADTSLWHGYVQDGKVYNSTGTVVDDALKDTSSTATNAKDISSFTQVFKTGSTIGGVKLEHAWNHDIVRYADGTVAILGQARVTGTGTDDPDKRMLYFRFDGKAWKATYLVKAGPKLYSSEQDYTGLGALHPDNPNVIYISTNYDPRDDKTTSSKREIWQGVTCDDGATWKWAPITKGSTSDQIRPIVPKWDASHTALLWLKGSYTSAQSYSFAVVGNITGP
jgi:hypothetical protein